ncbi:MAG: hypothetical protein K2Z81_14205 [Cyanobacteria bacterium]|nr:hypothetical protein [Cyanobacteriota bacterium]
MNDSKRDDKSAVEIRQLLSEAESIVADENYEAAQSVYFQALKLIEKTGTRLDKIECLDGLANAYFLRKSYIEARAVYQQLAGELNTSDGADLFAFVLLRQAQSTDKLDEYEAAALVYDKTLKIAEESLKDGDRLLTEIYESYAGLLRRARKNPTLLSALEQKARASRQQRTTRNQPTESTESTGKKRGQIQYTDEYAIPKSFSEKFQDLARSKPRVMALLFLSPVLLAVVALVTVVGLSSIGIEIGANNNLPVGSFLSRDQKIGLQIEPSKSILILNSVKKTELPTRSLSRWSQVLTTFNDRSANEYWLKPVPGGLLGEDGLLLYHDGSPMVRIESEMLKFAGALSKYYLQNKKLPESLSELTEAKLAVFETPGIEFSMVSIEAPADSSISTLQRQIEDGKVTWTAINQSKIFDRGATGNLRVRCLKAGVSSDYFFLVPLDSAGNYIKTDDGTKNIVLAWKSGSEPIITRNVSQTTSLERAKGIAFSEKSKEAVRSKYVHFMVSIFLFLLLIPLGQFMLKPLKESEVHWKYRTQKTGSYGQGFNVSIYLGLCLVYCGYVIWILCG